MKLILYYSDLLCEKIDMHADAFIQRIEALRKGDQDRVEFIEKMMLDPLDEQKRFIVNKMGALLKDGKEENGQPKL